MYVEHIGGSLVTCTNSLIQHNAISTSRVALVSRGRSRLTGFVTGCQCRLSQLVDDRRTEAAIRCELLSLSLSLLCSGCSDGGDGCCWVETGSEQSQPWVIALYGFWGVAGMGPHLVALLDGPNDGGRERGANDLRGAPMEGRSEQSESTRGLWVNGSLRADGITAFLIP